MVADRLAFGGFALARFGFDARFAFGARLVVAAARRAAVFFRGLGRAGADIDMSAPVTALAVFASSWPAAFNPAGTALA